MRDQSTSCCASARTEPWEVYYFEDRDHAVACYEQKAAQWTMCYLLVPATRLEEPIPMLLYCPNCGEQHIDAPQPEKGWTNPPHKSHECQHCFGPDGDHYTWRPCDRPTTGVAAITTKGSNDQDPKPPLVAEMRDELRELRNWQMELSE